MKHIICFIDDSEFEHDLVRNEIAPLVPHVEFVQTYTFEEVRGELGSTKPALFLLDLWGQDEDVSEPYLPPKEELEIKVSDFPTLDKIYKGLEEFRGDVNNEYLKRLFSVVDCWRTLFEEVCSRIGQNGKYGLSNLRQAREQYPGTPAVFYTRKSLIHDAVEMFRAGADGLFIKPTGTTDAETRRLTREYAPGLAEELMQIIELKGRPKAAVRE
jgi:DNA-binding NarL/FixJ family response regulator